VSQWRPAPRELPRETLHSGLVALMGSLVLWQLLLAARRNASSGSRRLIPIAVILTIYADLFLANNRANSVVHPELMTGNAVDITPRPTLGRSRVMISPGAHAALDATIFTSPEAAVHLPRRALVLNNNLLDR